MCIGIPMRVVESRDLIAMCTRGEVPGEVVEIDMSLVGPQPAGTWLLTFLGAAREVLTPVRAAQIADALRALDLAINDGSSDAIDALFPDLANRTPELPDFLKPTS